MVGGAASWGRGVDMKRKLLVALGAVPFMVAELFSNGAYGAVTQTQHLKNVTETDDDTLPCVGGLAEITFTYKGVIHSTETANGEHFTLAITGTVVADSLEAGVPTFTGRFTQRFGENSNPSTSNAGFNFHINSIGTDGSRIQFSENFHLIENQSGVLRVIFDKIRCH
jgi:hypothetical protein